MSSQRPITIIGGGLAGLTLGIALRKQNVPVKIIEAGHYPRHRVCGEFINGKGLAVLQRLRLEHVLIKHGARAATKVAQFIRGRVLEFHLPQSALCISRFELDQLLATEFSRAGGELATGVRVAPIDEAEGTIRATGRKPQASENGTAWFGLKGHARNVSLNADLEMHFGRDYYVGLCRLPGGAVNVCGLFRRKHDASQNAAADSIVTRLQGQPESLLHQRLAPAAWDKASFCAVAGLSFPSQPNFDGCSVGDSFGMIAPLTGNGMSIAFESASLASEPLIEYSRGKTSWQSTRHEIKARFTHAFCSRFRWAHLFQHLAFEPGLQTFALPLIRQNSVLGFCFQRTR
jgi:flavin-dependent dehydrogenase